LKTTISRRDAERSAEGEEKKTVHRGDAEDAEKRRRRKKEDGYYGLRKALKTFPGRAWERGKISRNDAEKNATTQ